MLAAAAIGQEPELAQALEAVWEHMQQEATDELICVESHGLLLIAAGVVFPTKGDLTVFEIEQAVIGDGDAVGAAPEKPGLALVHQREAWHRPTTRAPGEKPAAA